MKRKLLPRILTAALVLMFMVTLIPAAAAATEPSDVHWDGKIARWMAPTEGAVAGYRVSLELDGNYLLDDDTTETYYDFSDAIKNRGPGDYTFDVCAIFDDTSKSAIVASSAYHYEGEPHPHSIKWVDAKDATCTEQGVKGHFECPVCGKYFEDSKGIQEITDKSSLIIPAKGHDWGDWKTVKEATTNEEGQEKRVCKNDSSHEETRPIPKKAETQPTTKAQETTVAASTASTTPTGSTAPTATGSSNKSNNSGNAIIFFIIAAAVVVVAAIVIILVLVLSKKKNDNPPDDRFPPMNGSEYLPVNDQNYPPMNGSEYPPVNDQGYQPRNNQGYQPRNNQGYQPRNEQAYPPVNGSEYQPKRARQYQPDTKTYQPDTKEYQPETKQYQPNRDIQRNQHYIDPQRTKTIDDGEDNFDDYSGFDRR